MSNKRPRKVDANIISVDYDVRITGTVERKRGSFGFIRSSDGLVYMFIPSLLRDWTKFDDLVEGTKVGFVHMVTDKGIRAADIIEEGE
jgi:cold shock CspA family protein